MLGVPFVEIKPLTITPCYIRHTIGTIDTQPCVAPVAKLITVSLPTSFPGLTAGQQCMDLWAASTAKYPQQMVGTYEFWVDARDVTVEQLKHTTNIMPEAGSGRLLA